MRVPEFCLQAVSCYSEALSLDEQHVAALNNRAMAYLQLREYQKAAADCDVLLRLEPANVKGLLRRATARSVSARSKPMLLTC